MTGDNAWQRFADEAVRQALVNLEADAAPAGTMTVVLGPGWPGVLLHEAVGHGWKVTLTERALLLSVGAWARKVAADGVTIVDDGTLPQRRGSLSIDDEGTATEQTVPD